MKCPNNLEKECTCRWVCNNINNKPMKNLHITPEIEEVKREIEARLDLEFNY